jgi:hypothetical protein
MNKRVKSVAVGTVGILNVGAGDTKLSFDPSNPAERIRAARIVKDMIRRGYALLIEIEVNGIKKFTRALDFNEDVCEYVIADFDPLLARQSDNIEDNISAKEPAEAQADAAQGSAAADAPKRRGRPPGKRAVKAEGVRAVAVARSAGG